MVSRQLQVALERLHRHATRPPVAGPGDTAIASHKLTSKAGSGYEKVRNMLEYQEDHAVTRRAMERILKRTLRFGYTPGLGLPLLQEYVAAGYLPNDRIPESAAVPVEHTVRRYLRLAELMTPVGSLDRAAIRNWCISFAATEIHQRFYPSLAGEVATDAFHATARERLKYKAPVPDPEKDSQTYIACRRTLLRSTDAETAYVLWHKYLPDWHDANGEASVAAIAAAASRVLPVIIQQLRKPLSWRIAPKLKNYGIYFALLHELLETRGATVAAGTVADPAQLETFVRDALDKRYAVENKQIRRRGVRAVAYIFFTKIIVAAGLEFPYDLFVLRHVDYRSLAVNVAFHPILLFLMTSGIGKLGAKNTEAALHGVKLAVYDPGNLPIIVVNNKPGSGWLYATFTLLYAAMFGAIFGGLISALRALHFSPASIAIFAFFLAMVSYFGLRIRHMAKRWKVETGSEGIIAALWNLITLPIVKAGRFLSTSFSSINVFVFLMDFIIEAPFKLILRATDAFLGFLRDKREETY